MYSQTTQPSLNDQAGYGSDVSQGQNRRSSRVTTPIKQPGMIQPSPDSRRSIGQPQNPTNPNPSHKRKYHPYDPEDEGTESHITPTVFKKKLNKKKKNTPNLSQSTNDITSSQVIDLAQDSDEENSKAKNKRQCGNPAFDHIKDYFSEPFRRKDDVSHTINNIYM